MIGETRHDRRDHDADRNAGIGQRLDRIEPPARRRGARFHLAGELPVERGDGQEYLRLTARRHAAQDIDIARHEA